MAELDDGADTILIVDDEESVRRTFRDWLREGAPSCRLLDAADAEEALRLANDHAVDLAILDWALGAGDDGLHLLQDLTAFHPDVVAIMITGYANQATPLDAMRMGVRDYLDKNHDLSKTTFLAAVRKQLDILRPAKRARRLHRSLADFRAAVEKILPLVESTAALNDPVPLSDAVRGLIGFLIRATGARDGVLIVRHYEAGPSPRESLRVYGADGTPLEGTWVPFSKSVAAAVLGMQQPCILTDLDDGMVEAQPFEKGRACLLAAPLPIAPGTQAVLEFFDRPGGFGPDEQRLVQAGADLGTELLRQALGQKQTQRLLLDAIAGALRSGDQVVRTLGDHPPPEAEQPAPPQVLERLREGLVSGGGDRRLAEHSVALAEAIRVLAARHGTEALEHCLRLVQDVQRLLDAVTGAAPR